MLKVFSLESIWSHKLNKIVKIGPASPFLRERQLNVNIVKIRNRRTPAPCSNL